MLLTIGIMFGSVIGSIVTQIIVRRGKVGTLRIDRSEPYEPPMLFLELNKPVSYLQNGRIVKFEVKNENLIPHK